MADLGLSAASCSSLLDAIEAAIGGAEIVPKRTGCTFGSVMAGESVAQLPLEAWTRIVDVAARLRTEAK